MKLHRSFVPESIRSTDLAEAVGPRGLEVLDRIGTQVAIDPDREVIRQATVGRECFVVIEGQFEVSRDGDHVARLGVGDIVGEAALLTQQMRNASVTAVGGATVYALSRRDFTSLLAQSPEFAAHVHHTADARIPA